MAVDFVVKQVSQRGWTSEIKKDFKGDNHVLSYNGTPIVILRPDGFITVNDNANVLTKETV